MRMGIVSARRRRRLRKNVFRRALTVGASVFLAATAVFLAVSRFAPGGMQRLKRIWLADDEKTEQAVLTLPERELFALQLGVFDDGSRAAAQAARLESLGIQCMIWQREKLRIISSVALEKDRLDISGAKDQPGYVIGVKLEALNLRLEAGADALAAVQSLLAMPDGILMDLLEHPQKSLHEIVIQTRSAAEEALDAHPENRLYTQLAKSLQDWCDLMDDMLLKGHGEQVRSFAAVTICALCRELRTALTSS